MFSKPPKTILEDVTASRQFDEPDYELARIESYLEQMLQMEAIACKDWLTNKVDRSVTGKVAMQQSCGSVQLPLNNLGASTIDYQGIKGIATAIGHAPMAGLIDPAKASVLSISEALTNLIWAPLSHGLSGVSLSANWMWPAKNPGENARLYKAVEALSNFAIQLGINIPTGKDSLSMTQKYDDETIYSPGTVIISAAAEVSHIRRIVEPALQPIEGSRMVYINLSKEEYQLGGSSFAQLLNQPGNVVPGIADVHYFKNAFAAIQELIKEEKILAGHDISAGGMITTLLEMCFPNNLTGMDLNLDALKENDLIKILFGENAGIIIQVDAGGDALKVLDQCQIQYHELGTVNLDRRFILKHRGQRLDLSINSLRDSWFKSSYLLDRKQCGPELARQRFEHYKTQEIKFDFNHRFSGKASAYGIDLHRRKTNGTKAAIIREKGVNGDREMAYSLYLAGFDVKDVHMTDLIEGRENLTDVNMIVFVGGFSNSDVLGSDKGWAGAFLYNENAKQALDRFFERDDTLRLGV